VVLKPPLHQRIRMLFTWRGLRMLFMTRALVRAVPMESRGGHRTPSGSVVYCDPELRQPRRRDPLGWFLRFLGFREV
jgi:hypothetical protein